MSLATTSIERDRFARGELFELPLFRGVEAALLAELATGAEHRQVPPHTPIVRQDVNVERFRLVRCGILELVREEGEHEIGVLLLSAGDVIVPASAIWGEPSLLTVRALTTVRSLEFDSALIVAASRRSTRLANNLMMVMAGQWRMAVRSLLDRTCRSATQRLSAFLLRLADLQCDSPCPQLLFPKRHLASRLGISPETLSRALQTLADNGLHLRGRAIIVNDRAAVEALCGADPYSGFDERSLSVFAL